MTVPVPDDRDQFAVRLTDDNTRLTGIVLSWWALLCAKTTAARPR